MFDPFLEAIYTTIASNLFYTVVKINDVHYEVYIEDRMDYFSARLQRIGSDNTCRYLNIPKYDKY